MEEHSSADKVLSNFLNFIWVYNPNYENNDEIDFLYKKPRILFIEKVFSSYNDFLDEKIVLYQL